MQLVKIRSCTYICSFPAFLDYFGVVIQQKQIIRPKPKVIPRDVIKSLVVKAISTLEKLCLFPRGLLGLFLPNEISLEKESVSVFTFPCTRTFCYPNCKQFK